MLAVAAAQTTPNYVRTTLKNYGVVQTSGDEATRDVVSVEFTDGLGRPIESQTQIEFGDNTNTCIMSGVYYDDAGRPWKTLKPFRFDPNRFGSCTERFAHSGTAGDYIPLYDEEAYEGQALVGMACCYFNGDNGRPDAAGFPFSETIYYNDPLSRVKMLGAPGLQFSTHAENGGHPVLMWYMGVLKLDAYTKDVAIEIEEEVDGVVQTTVVIKTVSIDEGFVSAATLGDQYARTILDALMGTTEPNAAYYLTVTMGPEEDVFSQELKDVFGNTIRTWAHTALHDDGGEAIIAQYDYDILGNVLTETSPNELVDKTTYTYNTLGQLREKKTPDAGIVKYRYDEAGRVKLIQTAGMAARGEYLVRLYDKLGRETHVGIVDESFASFDSYVSTVRSATENTDASELEQLEESSDDTWQIRIARLYDGVPAAQEERIQALRRIGLENHRNAPWLSLAINDMTNPRGRLVAEAAWDESGENIVADFYGYDDEGRIRTHHKRIPGLGTQEFEYHYDIHGRLTEKVYKNGGKGYYTCYEYDEMGDLKSVRDDRYAETPTVEYMYDDMRQLQSRTYTGTTPDIPAATVSYQYNIRGWLTNLESERFAQDLYYDQPPGTQTTPRYDGNVSYAMYDYTGMSHGIAYGQGYEYDDISRLTRVDAVESDHQAEYGYDNIGRFQTKEEGSSATGRTYDYFDEDAQAGKTSRLRSIGTAAPTRFVYDQDGNVIVDLDKKMTIRYDWRGLPVEFRFYGGALPSLEANIDERGEYDGDVYATIHGYSNTELVSTVSMFYDAGGNRVYKIEH
jgi:YD repeat-containing protein